MNGFYNYNSVKIMEILTEIMFECNTLVKSQKKMETKYKEDGSPVTKADLEVDRYINEALNKIDPKTPIISEENLSSENDFLLKRYWLIDPIDGTRSFINGRDEYTINIALIVNGVPIIGIIGHPPTNKVWRAGYGTANLIHKNGNSVNLQNSKLKWVNPIILTSYTINQETKDFINSIQNSIVKKASSSIKFCELAESNANIYPRFSIISKWDIAAGHALLNEVGGCLVSLKGKEFNYMNSSCKTTKFIASGNKDWRSKVKVKKGKLSYE